MVGKYACEGIDIDVKQPPRGVVYGRDLKVLIGNQGAPMKKKVDVENRPKTKCKP